MKVVSDYYKAVMAQPVRPTSQFQARLEMIDREAEENATVDQGAVTEFATSILDKTHECDYLTFEQNFMRAGGGELILPEGDYLSSGYVSAAMTDENGQFQQQPVIEITLPNAANFVGMTYTFIKAWPSQIRVTAYLGDSQVTQFVSLPDRLEFVDGEHHIPDCNRITFEFPGMNEPFRRLRIARLTFGLIKTFTNEEVVSVQHDMTIDPLSSSLPSQSLTMNVLNFDKDYNPDNPGGLWEYFDDGQPLLIRYGVETEGGTEWVDAAYLYLDDAPTVRGNTAAFKANDAISYLTDVYYKGIYRTGGITLYDLAKAVLLDAGVSGYTLSPELKDFVTFAPLPEVSHRECLQVIANAGKCVLYTNASGQIIMEEQAEPVPEDFYLDFEIALEKPTVKKTAKLKSVGVTVHSYAVQETAEELYTQEELNIQGTQRIQVSYEASMEQNAVVTGGTLVSAEYYARTAFLTIQAQGTVKLAVSGRKLVETQSVVTVAEGANGESCPLDNPLITDSTWARDVGIWVGDYLKNRNSYEVNFRQDFRLDANDVIYIQSDFEERIPARITKLQFKLPGQTGAVSVRRLS